MKTRVLRVPIAGLPTEPPLDQRLTQLCDVQWVAGFRLAASFLAGMDIVLIFQTKG